MLSSTPVTRLSSARTSHPSAIRRSQRCEPRKPAPPVTTARMNPPPKTQQEILSRSRAIDHTDKARYHAPICLRTATRLPHTLEDATSPGFFLPPQVLC